jgi:hypothetical protein
MQTHEKYTSTFCDEIQTHEKYTSTFCDEMQTHEKYTSTFCDIFPVYIGVFSLFVYLNYELCSERVFAVSKLFAQHLQIRDITEIIR